MLDVDQNDNVTLRGSRNALILIDNKPMKFFSLVPASRECNQDSGNYHKPFGKV